MSDSLRLRSLLAMGVSAAALLAVAAPAYAADADSSSSGATTVGEVVVTAQKKEERLQDVPIAVSAFSQDSLEKSKIDGGPNLVLAIPNVNFSKGNFTGYNFQIRGVGSKLVAASGDAGTGIHLNNAPLTANNLFETEFYDVERVEVLRGPQGTLYGRNATGGVVNIITAKPGHDFEAMLRLEGGNYGERKFRGMINVPLGDVFSVRVAATTLKRDGFGVNDVTHNDADDRNLYGLRATIGFTPSDNFKAYFMYDKFHESDNRSRVGKQLCTKDTGPASVGGVGYSAAAGGLIGQIERGFFTQGCQATSLYSPNVLGTVQSQSTLGGLFGMLGGFQTGDAYAGKMQDPNIRNIESSFDPIYRANTDIYEFNIDWNLNDSLKLTALSSYTKSDLYTRQDYNRYTPTSNFNTSPNPVNALAAAPIPGGYGAVYGAIFPGGVINDPQNGAKNQFATSDISSAYTKQFTQELRLQSSFDGPLNFNVGGIYLDYKATGDYYVMFNTGTGWYQVNDAIGAATVHIDPNHEPDRSGHNYYDAYSPYHLKSRAAFGEVYYQMAQNFKWTLGLRYTDDDKVVENHSVTLGTNGTGPASAVFEGVRFKETTGRFGFDWKPDISFTSQTLIYAFFSKGYKAGGLNSPCTPGLGVSCSLPTFAPEFVNSFEVGAKNTLLDGKLVVNLTAFAYNYKGYQVSKIVNRASTNENIDAKIKGAEFESIWSPVHGLRFNTSVGYLDTEISKGLSIDTFNRTQSNALLTVVKSSAASNCVLSTADAATALGIANGAGNPFALLQACTVPADAAHLASAGTVMAGGAIATGTNAFGGLVSDGIAVNLKGKELPNAPHWTFSVGAQYTLDFGGGWSATARGDYYRQTKSFARIYNSVPDQIDGWDNVNLTFTVNNDHGFAVEGFVKNAANKTAITDSYLSDDSSGLFRNTFYTEPRTYGVAISQKW